MSAHLDPHRPGDTRALRIRLRARWAHDGLDRRLADGADPSSDPVLQARAERLIGPAYRARLAAGLERVVAAADDPATALSSAAPVRCGPVRGARHELMGLAGELRHMPAPRPRGVAVAERLLTEPSSVLFTASSRDEVAHAVRDAVEHMRADERPAGNDAPRGGIGREATPLLRTTAGRTNDATEHHFHLPTVAPLPSRAPVDSSTW